MLKVSKASPFLLVHSFSFLGNPGPPALDCAKPEEAASKGGIKTQKCVFNAAHTTTHFRGEKNERKDSDASFQRSEPTGPPPQRKYAYPRNLLTKLHNRKSMHIRGIVNPANRASECIEIISIL